MSDSSCNVCMLHLLILMISFGLSSGNIGMLILSLALFFSMISALLAGFIKPLGERQVDQLLIAQANQTDFDKLISGRFQSFRLGEKVIYARNVTDQYQLEDIFINALSEITLKNYLQISKEIGLPNVFIFHLKGKVFGFEKI